MKLRRNIVPFLVSAIVMLTVCVPVFSATPRADVSSVAVSLSVPPNSAAPQTTVPQDRKTFRYAVNLYDSGMYERAAELFAGLAGVGVIAWDNGAVGAGDAFDAPTNGLGVAEIDFNGAIDIEALGYYVLCSVKMQTRGYDVLANSYILKYPYASLVPQIRFAQAGICFDAGDYRGADSQLRPLSRRRLYHNQIPPFLFMRALSSLELGEEDAKALFMDVINYKKSNHYVLPAHYFLGYIYYGEGNLSEAREHFALAVADPQFRTLAEHYLVECGGAVSQSATVGQGVAASVGVETGQGTAVTQNSEATATMANPTTTTTASTDGTVATDEIAAVTTEAVADTNTDTPPITNATATMANPTTTTTASTDETITTDETTVTPATTPTTSGTAESASAGEAAYRLILDSYDRGDFDEVEDRVLDFAESADPDLYWLAKSFIILGDSYAEQGDFAKALATFESVRDGYNPSEPDDVMDELEVRIRRAEEMLNKN